MAKDWRLPEIEMLYFEREWDDAKRFCIEHGLVTNYRGKRYFLCWGNIYDEERNLIIESPENGFLDLFEYYEYFEQPTL